MHKEIQRRLDGNDKKLDIFATFILKNLEDQLTKRDIAATSEETTKEQSTVRYTSFAEYEDEEVALYWSLDEDESGWTDVEFGVTFADNAQHEYRSTLYVSYNPQEDVWMLGYENQPFKEPSELAAKIANLAFDFEEEGERKISEEQAWKSITALTAGYSAKRRKYKKSRRQ